ncbi:mannose-1-phosphate guanylyltransferase/mannose-1-phosphate guanylyltransferase / mannose-6-phosphate isomerase [Desulfocicer vacuolatum DSM 3385]|uniref:mannose-1-phosphate guanylyltransferase n=1 Tax=Desulfocicer vacuolatum DSM 3385 TaxID=1121400 RepID=A0A1W1ZCK1_9BACT|nr:mannose-1-phosphate guanylyltransferase/mannose-6-phosphate isomerase [Desulfocicer vacuolatum]SMC46154.1 mannose-1-phosphate guanylyltransferase/mannose-1-phosphate guanylyltransferase / mannose-6-phosphate isomerase [Desulfocicer vacuolatum DSM 3385]
MIVPVILAGGSGTRLWPLSRGLFPKQLINLIDAKSMLQNTLLRPLGIPDIAPPVVICNEDHRFMAAEQMRRINCTGTILLEPVGRNTAPAIAAAALQVVLENPRATLLILPADHDIKDLAAFNGAVAAGEAHAAAGYLVTFGIVPTGPETGYGYIKKGDSVTLNPGEDATGCAIERFVEKPDLETAKEYVASDEYLWNSGMFMFRADKVLEALTLHVPDMVTACRDALEKGEEDLDFFRLDSKSFARSPSDSIDYAVMEKTEDGVVIPLDAGWNDVGSWDALWHTGEKDKDHNVLKGDVLVSDVKNCYLNAESRLIAAVGLENHVVVETKDAVLVAPRNRVQEVKRLVEALKKKDRPEVTTHREVFRPWGSYETIDLGPRFQVKRITVKPGAKLSLQKHFHRAEHWTVVSGTAIITKGEEEILLRENESVYIPLGYVHRMENPGRIPLELIEVQSGSYLGEDDIVRFDDIYGREKKRG